MKRKEENVEWWFGYKDGRLVTNGRTEGSLGKKVDVVKQLMVAPVTVRLLQDWRNYEAVEIGGFVSAVPRETPIPFRLHKKHKVAKHYSHHTKTKGNITLRLDVDTYDILQKVENKTQFIRDAIKEKYERTLEYHKQILTKLNLN